MDKFTVSGILGSLLTIVAQSIEELHLSVQLIGGLGGLVVIYLSARGKYLSNQLKKRELEQGKPTQKQESST